MRDAPAPEGGLGGGLEELRVIIEDLRMELRALRRENELLRRAQVAEPWRTAGLTIPTSLLPPSTTLPQLPCTPTRLQPLPAPSFSPLRPLENMDLDLPGVGPRSREHGDTPEAKRTPGVVRSLVVDDPNVV